ncbi:GlsB/YeaQ/YmgE family stress response membrane protein [Riemerella columbina]|uniref:GlsB/YeaQ/YmgE family stress response membrane protein n=1 Tax=Riemerella columbina TaxID=103810 RepID=UPI00266EB3FD|nr:GlsB/YeaQ/YmgE family stress response membrane protein [Riemerella columbina]WKS94889.1 GlsB/YeaQ/YmgE family stress response membrane protein [Riemerella columbina]
MGILSWLLFGLIAGAIAKAIHPGKDPSGWLITIVIGIVGSMLGGWLGSMFLGIDVTGFNFSSFMVAVGGSVLLLAIYSAITKK